MLKDYIKDKPTIISNRLIIRPFKNDDVKYLREWTNNISIYKYWGKNPGKYDLNPELLVNKVEKPSKSFHLYIEKKDDNNVIGDIYLYLIEKDIKGKIAIRINPKFHNKGFGSESVKALCEWVFTHTEIINIWSDVDKNNIASIKMLEKSGFIMSKEVKNSKMVSVVTDFYVFELNK